MSASVHFVNYLTNFKYQGEHYSNNKVLSVSPVVMNFRAGSFASYPPSFAVQPGVTPSHQQSA